MKRREALKTLGAGATALALRPSLAQVVSEKKRPNFLFLFTDDQTFRSIGSLNNPAVKTPNIDRLVKKGVTFTHCFNQGSWSPAVCICSRAMLNTGQTLYHCEDGIGQNGGEPTVPLWGEVLGNAGYDTFMTGKWHNREPSLQKSFKHIGPHGGGMFPSKAPEGSDADPYMRPRPGNTWAPDDTSLDGHWRKQEDGSIVHSSELWADASIEFLERHAEESDDPFFMYVAFHAPHDPRQSPTRFIDMYPLGSIEIPPNYLPEHPFDQGHHWLRDEMLAPFPRTEEAVKLHLQEYYAIISHADEQIGRILDTLEKSGEADNTVILFSADHGLAVGQHGLMGKQNQYDCSVRMPLILAGPGLESGEKIDSMVYLPSLFPTACEMAGVEIPETVEFPSLMPLLNGETDSLHDAVFGAYMDFQRMVRTDRYKLIEYPHNGEVQLFDLKKDPWEQYDLAENPSYVKLRNELKQKLVELQDELDDPMVN
ncbi:MAG: sulfatase-like hydrolase/transferase [Candidatus Omnitrophica bacterium]|nr:sulfatase-like hydrolase/transferase [Candidatus Omnitrophota bacterium]